MLSVKQKASAWEKAPDQLTPEERIYVDSPVEYETHLDNCFDLEKLGAFQHQSAWVDVQRKASRLVMDGSVTVIHKRPYDLNQPQAEVEVSGRVRGDNSSYEGKILLPHPQSRAIRSWSCSCTWARYVWKRRPIYVIDRQTGIRKEINKRYEGRVCSHILALWWSTMNMPVGYDEVDPQVLKHFAPQMIEQGSLFSNDDYTVLLEKGIGKERVDPGDLLRAGFDIEVLNESIQPVLQGFFPEFDNSENSADKPVSWVRQMGEDRKIRPTYYDNKETVQYKQDYVEGLISINQMDKEMDRLNEEYSSQDISQEERQAIASQLDDLAEKRQEETIRIEKLEDEIVRLLNFQIRVLPRAKAEDVVEELHWWMVNDKKRAQKYLGQLGVDYTIGMEALEREDPTGAQEIRDLITQGQVDVRDVVQNMVDSKYLFLSQKAKEQMGEAAPAEENVPEVDTNQQGFWEDEPRTSKVETPLASFLSTDFSINDITIYIQRQIADGQAVPAYTRREIWAEQRGGLFPHPDAMPRELRPDGNRIYATDDLGYDPQTGQMGSTSEERGTYGRVAIGDTVNILSVDPRDRVALIEKPLDAPAGNHQKIVVWVSLKDLDLV